MSAIDLWFSADGNSGGPLCVRNTSLCVQNIDLMCVCVCVHEASTCSYCYAALMEPMNKSSSFHIEKQTGVHVSEPL